MHFDDITWILTTTAYVRQHRQLLLH
jgi:hypothetical protein